MSCTLKLLTVGRKQKSHTALCIIHKAQSVSKVAALVSYLNANELESSVAVVLSVVLRLRECTSFVYAAAPSMCATALIQSVYVPLLSNENSHKAPC